MSTVETKLDKLNADNYSHWSLVMTSLLKSKGLWKYCVETVDTNEKEEDMMKTEEAKSLMYMAMSNQQIQATGVCLTAKELWDKIRENHQGAQKDLMNTALAAFINFRYHKGENIIQYCGRFETALGNLTKTGQKPEESLKIMVFRKSLPKDIQMVIRTWAMANPNGKCSELISQLKQNYHIDKEADEDEVALYSEDKPTNKGPYRGNKQSYGRGQSSSQYGNQTTKPYIQCSYKPCGMRGHSWKDCRKKKADDQRKKQFANRNNSRNNNQYRNGNKNRNNESNCTPETGNVALMAQMVDGSGNPEPNLKLHETMWIVDSGATSHYTPYARLLEDYVEYEEPKPVQTANGHLIQAYGEGTMHFRSGNFEGKLTQVKWAPQMKNNLFCLCKPLKAGFKVEFSTNPDMITFFWDGKPALKGYMERKNMFILKLLPMNDSENTTEEMAMAGSSLEDWHKRFAHVGTDAIKSLLKSEAVTGLKIDNRPKHKCLECAMSKICRCSHPSRTQLLADKDSAVLHIDTVGPTADVSLGGSKYFVLAVEEYSGYKLIDFASSKSEIPVKVKTLINKVELETKRQVRMIVTDNGTEYKNSSLNALLVTKGIIHELSAPFTPEQNGRAERANRTVIEGTIALLKDSKLPLKLWAEAAATFVYASNRTLSSKDPNKTKYEMYCNEKPDVNNLRYFGQVAVIKKPKVKKTSKWEAKGECYSFVGYTNRRNTYRFYDEDNDRIIISCDAVFLETHDMAHHGKLKDLETEKITLIHNVTSYDTANKTISSETESNNSSFTTDHEPNESETRFFQANDEQNNSQEGDQPSYNSSNNSSETLITGNQNDSNELSVLNTTGEQSRRTLRSTNTSFFKDPSIPKWFWGSSTPRTRNRNNQNDETALAVHARAIEMASLACTLDDEPMDFNDAMNRPDKAKWLKAMDEEIQALEANKTWELVPRSTSMRPIKCKWVYRIKRKSDGTIERYKARLVAKGYSQIPNVDYKETFAPTASMNTIRILFGLANQHNMEILQFDVKTAFLYGDLNETLYMEFPQGYPNPNNNVCKLIKSLYGLKQAPRQWNLKFDNFLKEFKLQQSTMDKCLYYNETRTLFLTIYVDDGLVISTDKSLLNNLVHYLQKNLDLKTMECEAYLGFKVVRNRNERWLFLQQPHFISKVLEKFGMAECKPASTPEEVITEDSVKEAERLDADVPFKELIGSLLYLVTCTRPDIAHAVSVASRTSEPTTVHWNRLKRILRYLQATRNLGILFRWEEFPTLIGFSDADYANDVETRRSTTGYCIMYGSTPIAWRCQRQAIVTLSTTEAEYVAGCDMVKELLPIRNMMLEMKQINKDPTLVLIDNQSTVKISIDDSGQQRTKHIDVRKKWLTEKHASAEIVVEHITGDKQAADILTKPLHKTKFETNRKLLMATVAMLSVLSIACAEANHTFVKVSPLHFKPSNYHYYDGDLEFRVRMNIINPCLAYFMPYIKLNDKLNPIMDNCFKDFRERVTDRLTSCHNETSLEQLVSSRYIPALDTVVTLRIKRTIPMFITAIAVLSGTNAFGTITDKRIESLEKLREQEVELLHEGMKTVTETRNSLQKIEKWSSEVSDRLSKVQIDSKDRIPKIAALIQNYLDSFSQLESKINKLNEAAADKKIPAELRTWVKDITWEEPAAKWSKLYRCAKTLTEDKDFQIDLHFTLPRKNSEVKIMESIATNFYKTFERKGANPEVCWMKYSGPQYMLYNITSECVNEVNNWSPTDGPVRAQSCTGKEESISQELEPLFDKTDCSESPKLIKKRIQDREYNGLHKIYCHPWNITLENIEYPCPNFVTELESRNNYTIANIQHHGIQVEQSSINTVDLHINKQLLTALKVDDYYIKPLNLTASFNATHDSYFNKLQLLPKKVQIVDLKTNILNWLKNSPLSFIYGIMDKFWEYIETVGIIIAVICGGILLMLMAPILEILFIGFSLVKFIARAWISATRKVVHRVSGKRILKKKNYWDEEDQKLI